MSKFYDLTALKEYVEKNKILDKFTPEEQEDIKEMAKELEKLLEVENNETCNKCYSRNGVLCGQDRESTGNN